ncbi:MAG: polyphosphate:AMP phosphotransferase [Betaproteobacteria bacterium]|nr:MAG: polyphosphate:AMP phosphotransferase [Betaproteobacteria bacterium]
MLESAEIGHKVPKRVYAREEPKLRELLLNAQFDLSQSGRGPLLLVISGVEGGGRGETANKLTEWMDPRHIHVVAFGPRAPEEAARPPAWRYWRSLPPKGKIGILMNAWYNESMLAHVQGKIDADQVNTRVQAIREHEQMLTDEGFVLLKFWIHLSKAAQKQRLQELEHDPTTAWRVTREDWKTYRIYNKAHELWESLLRETSTGAAPWHVVEGTDGRYRYLTVGKILLDALRTTLAPRPATPKHAITPPAPSVIDNVKLIRDLDLSKKLPVKDYDRALEKHQGKLATLTRHKRFAKRSLILVFEGVDAAGKGGAIRRVTGALDARQYVTVPVAAPTEEERAFPYLWRFWRNVPRYGGITIFDRSWYGRVLVERVEGYCSVYDWMRAYDEINQFEEQLTRGDAVVVKFWLQISKAEQLRRFKARERSPFKQFKITADDWRNRKKWNAYEQAVCDMVDRTSTEIAPWTLVEAEDKYYARIKILNTITDRVKQAFDR